MLKKISVEEVRLGMYLHALEGAWMDHPFWRTRFVISDPAALDKLRRSKVREVWIDPGQGLDVAAPQPLPHPAQALPAARGPSAGPAAPPQVAAAPRASVEDEIHHAAAVCNRAKHAVASMFQEARMGKAIDAQSCLPLVADISSSVMRNPGALVSLARLKTQDEYTYMHSVAVCALMIALGSEAGLDADACRQVGLAGLLHDLGKATMPLEVLNKPGKLTDEEFALIRLHPERGHELLGQSRGAGIEVMDVCLHHHEKMDGSGYPHRLAGEAISLVARMGAICDVYDAITSNRPYKKGWDPAESIARMASWTGHFDPALFRHFVKSLGIYPIGALVRLESGRLAVVVEHNPQALTAPVVRAFFSTRNDAPISVQRIDLAGGGDRIVGRESPEKWGFKHLDELWAEGQVRKTS